MNESVLVIGAGIGGLVAALDLASAGIRVTLVERQATPGGKLRVADIDGTAIDAGPTVFTMRWVFDAIFAAAGTRLSDHLELRPAGILARHAWGQARLDLFADLAQSAEAIGEFAGAADADAFLAVSARARKTYETLENTFIRAPLPTPLSLVRNGGIAGLASLLRINPFETLAGALAKHFTDPRLAQLFGRYATYCGSSPYLAPATLMLVSHVERDGVWLIQGGMHRLASALAALATARGVDIRYDTKVDRIEFAGGRPSAAICGNGERLSASHLVLNADPAALAAGCFGPEASAALASNPTRSLSAITWAMHAKTNGFPLVRHNVFFSPDSRQEFDELQGRRIPREPTIYVCAQDRDDAAIAPKGRERLLVLINAPANGDTHAMTEQEIDRCADRVFKYLTRSGLHVDRVKQATIATAPQHFARLYPATGGALYGPAVHGAMATFKRPGSRTRIPGLYLAGGGTHPGAGLPMAALSGRLAAASLLQDLASSARSRGVATRGGISTR